MIGTPYVDTMCSWSVNLSNWACGVLGACSVLGALGDVFDEE